MSHFNRYIVRLDPQYRRRQNPREFDYSKADWDELTALAKRPGDTPRAYLTPERIAEILAQPEARSKFFHPAKPRKARAARMK